MSRFTNQAALITGGTEGLGESHVRARLIHEPAAPGGRPISDFHDPEPFAIPRLGDPADVSAALLYLASPEASFAIGTELVLDGGLLPGPALPIGVA
jgi:3alpha(or 20beta)-hydroxysteroid dehydrogenase